MASNVHLDGLDVVEEGHALVTVALRLMPETV